MNKSVENKKSISAKLAERALNNAGKIPVNPRSLTFWGEQKVPKALQNSLKK